LPVEARSQCSGPQRRPSKAGLRGRRSRVLPGMAIAVDHFRLILLVN
jgi:hypothetical protein